MSSRQYASECSLELGSSVSALFSSLIMCNEVTWLALISRMTCFMFKYPVLCFFFFFFYKWPWDEVSRP